MFGKSLLFTFPLFVCMYVATGWELSISPALENGLNKHKEKAALASKTRVIFTDYADPKITADCSVVSYSQTTSVVNGRPFLPLGIYAVNASEMAIVKDLGFNLVQNYHFFKMTKVQKKEYLNTARKNKLMVFAGLNGTEELTEKYIAEIKKTVKDFKNHPALYAWYLADEPTKKKTKPEELRAVYKWIKQMDPNHPVISSNWELENFKDACDVDMRQLYQGIPSRLTPALDNYLKNYKADKTWVAILNSYDSGWGAGKDWKSINPTTVFSKLTESGIKENDPEWKKEEARWSSLLKNPDDPETAGFQTSISFPNTPEAIRGAFYWALIHGSNGVYYWLFSNPDSTLNLRWGWYTIFFQPSLCGALQSALRELKELSRYLVNPSQGSISFRDTDNPGIFVWSKILDHERIIIILNETGQEFQGKVNLAPLNLSSRRLKVYHEDGRTVSLDNNVVKDSFKKDEVHVYFEIKK